MQLTNHIDEHNLFLQMAVSNKVELLTELTKAVCSESFLYRNPDYSPDIILERIQERERERPTVIGHGIAFPHARLQNFSGFNIAMATLKNPIDFDEGESEPISIACMVLTPRQTPTISLKIMSGLSKGLADPAFRNKLLATTDMEEAIHMLKACDFELEIPISGRDIMHPPKLVFKLDTPTAVIAKQFYKQQLDVAPVLNEENNIVGEVTTNRMFRFGVPPFFHQLKSVSFISAYDPFEKYFAEEEKLTAQDIMFEKVAMHAADSTLLEIVFDLAVKRYPQVYIVDDEKKLIGVINRADVLENIINF